MKSNVGVWREAMALAAAGAPLALATVARQRGSLPMAGDAKMVVTAEGRRKGTVGGGCVEADVVAGAIATLGTGQPALSRHTLNADVAGDLGLSCGGTVDLFLEPLPPTAEVARLCEAVAEGIVARRAVTIATDLEWKDGPGKTAAVGDTRLTVGGGAKVDPMGLPRDPHGFSRVDPSQSVFLEWASRTPRVVIFGAGHVGGAIARAASAAGFYVVIVDDREEFANRDRHPTADEVIAEDFNAVIDGMRFDADDFVLAATRGHSYDATIVQRTAASHAGYVGMLGSKRKRSVIFKALESAGVPGEALQRVKSPIGLPIGADTPEEIAVSVVAELIQRRRGQARQELP